MFSTRYCKCHYLEGEWDHWGLLDRKAFAAKDAKPHFTPDTPLVPQHLRLELNFDWDEERVWGTTLHDLLVKGHDVREINFDAVNLDVTAVRISGRRVDFDNDGNRIVIPLGRKLVPGRRLQVQLDHSVTRPSAGIYFTKPDKYYPGRFKTVWTQGQDEDSQYYFPCFDKPNFKQTTEVILHLPPGMFGLSNGRLVKKSAGATESVCHYKLEIPYSTYLLSIVAGEFVERKEKWDGIDIKWYVQKGREKEAFNAFKDTAKMIRFFSEYTGYRYPYKHYTQIAVPEFIFGGMENFTVTTQTDLTLHDKRAHADGDSNGLVAHEAAHTWFGNVVTAKNWSHAWLHESFATYFDALYTRRSKGEDEFRYQMLEDAETYFAEDAKYRRPIVTHVYKEPIDLFDAHLYPGGAVRLHHLKSLAGEAFFRDALAIYLKRHEFGVVETVDFIRCLEEVTARNFDAWLNQWIHRGGYPVLEIGYQWDETARMAVIEIKQTQKAEKKGQELLFGLDLNIGFYFSGKRETFPVAIKNKEEKFCFRLPGKPRYFRLDPDYECPCKKVKLDISRSLLHEQLKQDSDPMGRIEAVSALTSKTSTADIRLLIDRLRKETFWGVGARIAGALGKIGGNLARDGLVKGLKHSNAKARRAIVQALGKFTHDQKAADAVRRVARGDVSYRVEAAALRALGSIEDKESRWLLEETLGRPSHNDMGQGAIYLALGDLEDETAWDLLVQGAEYGAAKNSRGAAMKSLARLARRFPHRKEEAIGHLARFCKESRGTPAAVFRGKLGAIGALQSLEDLRAVPVLRALAAGETDGRLIRRAEDAIAALFDSAKKPEEIKTLRAGLDGVLKENKSFRDRLDLLEKKEKSASGRKHKNKKGS